MHRRLFFGLPFSLIAASAHAQKQLPPESFVRQIQQNARKVVGLTRVIYAGERYRKVKVFEAATRLVDVVRSDSVLHPYIGKLHLVTVLGHGQPMDTREKASESEVVRRDWNTGSSELMIFFAPKATVWELSRLQMRIGGVFEDLAQSEFSNFKDDLLSDIVEILEMPIRSASARPTVKPSI